MVVVTGNFTLDPTGELVVIVNGGDAGTLMVDGCAQVQGTLRVVFQTRPMDGQKIVGLIEISGSCSISGDFSNIVIEPQYGDAMCDDINVEILRDAGGSTSLGLLVHVEDTCGGGGNKARIRWVIIGSAVGGVMLIAGIAFIIVYFRVRHGHLRRLRPLFFWIEDEDGLGMELS